MIQQLLRFAWWPILCLVIAWLLLPYASSFSWHRTAIGNGEALRVILGSFAHNNLNHFLLNLLSFSVVSAIALQLFSNKLYALVTLAISLIGGAAMFAAPYQEYLGLSGLIHGLLAFICIYELCFAKKRYGLLLGAGLALKLGWEQIYGSDPNLAQLIGIEVAVDAHLYYALSGLLIGLVYYLWRRLGLAS